MEFTYNKKIINTNKIYALTITTRKRFNVDDFKFHLLAFLDQIEYPVKISGFLEYHKTEGTKDKIHGHFVTCRGQPPNNNKTNEFHFHLKKLVGSAAIAAWHEYMQKDYCLTECLFSDSEDFEQMDNMCDAYDYLPMD